MKYKIWRASDYGDNQPTQESQKEGKEWFIDINSLKDLTRLVDKEGDIVLGEDEIIIYDNYLE